jgi:hypothetical protein
VVHGIRLRQLLQALAEQPEALSPEEEIRQTLARL